MSVESLELLSDVVLLMVLEHLRQDDLLACRLVSKRLGRLVLRHRVWRHRHLYLDDYRAGAVLRLAPILKSVTAAAHRTLPLITSTCAIKGLELRDEVGHIVNASNLALVIRVQESLGRLRHLVISFLNLVTGADALMRTLAVVSDLESLRIVGCVPSTTHRVVQASPSPSLKVFRCELTKDSESFVNTVLGAHAETLEDVGLCSGGYFGVGYSGESDTTARLLATMPRLQKLECEALPGLQAVAVCAALHHVTVNVPSFKQRTIEWAAELLRAGPMRSVCLNYDVFNYEVGSKLIEALGERGGSPLEFLAIIKVPQVGPLLRALPSLPALRELQLLETPQDDADELLRGLTPQVAPALRILGLTASGIIISGLTATARRRVECAHEWLHGDGVKAAVVNNPLLHTELRNTSACGDCEACMQGCHQEVMWGGDLGLFSHDLDKCPSPEDHIDTDSRRSWVQIRENVA
ncbi:uncharacterized protein LOC113213540 [Frankliniella occidentalis]|uniref:Uncharacterized protein LOC113213540 n=1 Tax=Frankliniella occidentalis TaxID=133901 RepID=A0A6J1T677_FRAOC|nr:uncharacterized protein LOC113213540 [Frankliniella occidentalis]XP_052133671.1 uncharacterized protein LOC113213540 [Frankliniella occidentalis]